MIRTQATPEQIAAFRAGMLTAREKRNTAAKMYVFQTVITRPDGWEFQLQLFVDAKQANGFWQRSYDASSAQKYDVIKALCEHRGLMAERHRVSAIEFTRISPGKLDPDNLPGAFKAPLDGASVSLVEGEEALKRLWVTRKGKKRVRGKDIGHFDGRIIGEGKMSCRYDQLTHELDRRLYGVRIRFRLRSIAHEPSAT